MTEKNNVAEPAPATAETPMETPVTPDAAPATTAANETAPAETTPATTTDTDATAAPDELITIQVEPMAVEAPGTIAAFLATYLANGYYLGEDKVRYPDPALIDQAEMIGKTLAAGGVTRASFNRMVKTLKDSKKLPAEAQQGALKEVLAQVTELENHKKAPPLLREVVARNRAAVQTGADFAACLKHFQHIGIFLEAAKATVEQNTRRGSASPYNT